MHYAAFSPAAVVAILNRPAAWGVQPRQVGHPGVKHQPPPARPSARPPARPPRFRPHAQQSSQQTPYFRVVYVGPACLGWGFRFVHRVPACMPAPAGRTLWTSCPASSPVEHPGDALAATAWRKYGHQCSEAHQHRFNHDGNIGARGVRCMSGRHMYVSSCARGFACTAV